MISTEHYSNVNKVHLHSYQQAYKKVLNLELPAEVIVTTFGMPERKQHETVFRELGIGDTGQIETVIKSYFSKFRENVSSLSIPPLPGAVEFLRYLSETGNKRSIVSGNT